ncbi:MAG: TetR/AcrR family transcriptional regulator [Bacillales bacterium]|nr:TetR/AcrR family transcriptional regulator [Bacillales bacterium]
MKEEIILECINLFNIEGCKFHLDDVAKNLKISKKTIYKYFSSKEDILKTIVEESADAVKERQIAIYNDNTLETKEKLFQILTAKSKFENVLNLSKAFETEIYYPDVYTYFQKEFEKEWERAISLVQKGIDEGTFKDMNIDLIKNLLLNGMQMLYKGDILARNHMTYHEAIIEIAKIVLEGISK